jgi:hypothetical protein
MSSARIPVSIRLIVLLLELFRKVRVAEITKELLGTMIRAQVLVEVAQVALIKVAGPVALRLHHFRQAG